MGGGGARACATCKVVVWTAAGLAERLVRGRGCPREHGRLRISAQKRERADSVPVQRGRQWNAAGVKVVPCRVWTSEAAS